MRRLIPFLPAALIALACSVSQGLQHTQRGLAIVDVAIEAKIGLYQAAVPVLRDACAAQLDPAKCERQFGVDDETVTRVMMALDRASAGYDKGVDGFDQLVEGWSAAEPDIQRAIDAAKELRQ